MISQQQLKGLLHYDPDTGVFTWIRRRRGTRFGHGAGRLNHGYVSIRVLGREYGAHRLAWLYMTGRWPADQIDHKNCIRNNNRWDNLREADYSLNQQNRKSAPSNNRTTGLLGVRPRGKRFMAKIMLNGEVHYLGTFDTPQLAHGAYLDGKRRLHPGCTI